MDSTVSRAKIAKIIRVALLLLLATVIEFIIAFTIGAGLVKTIIFIVLTLVKAFYIMGEFMHLSHERRGFIISFLIPMILVALLIFILLYESDWMNVPF